MRIPHIFIAITFTALSFGCAGLAYAQLFEVPNPFSLIANPQIPDAGEEFSIEAATPTTDSQTLRFEWTINGASRADLSGMGRSTMRIVAGAVGSQTRVGVRAFKGGALFAEASRIISPANLSLDWTADTYVPSWYRGRALPTPGSVVTIIATPEFILNGRRIAAENLIYRWTLDGQDFTNGAGERSFAIQTKAHTSDSYQVTLTVEDTAKRIRKQKSIFIITTKPTGTIYHVSPLGGIESRHALSSFSPTRPSVFDFQFEPFFFKIASKNDLSYHWSLGPLTIIGAPENPYFITINTERREPGAIPVSVSVDDSIAATAPVVKAFTFTIP